MPQFNQNNLEKSRVDLARGPAKQGVGRIIRFFVFFSLFILIIINWNTVKGIFNYKAIYADIISSVKIGGSENYYRIRVGDYRTIYEIDDKENKIDILRIRHRKDAYLNL